MAREEDDRYNIFENKDELDNNFYETRTNPFITLQNSIEF